MAGLPYGSVPPPPPSSLIPGARRSSLGAADEKPVCKFGRSCFRRNKEHFDAFSHPWLDEATNNEVSLPRRPSGPPRSPRASELSPPPSARKVILDTVRGDGEPDGSATPAASSSEAPSLAQALGMSAVSAAVRADASKPMCRYGKDCYNRSTAHLEQYAHAGDEAPKEPRLSVAMRGHGRPRSPFAAAGRMVAAAGRPVSPPRSNDIDPSQSAPLQGSVVLSNYVDEKPATDEWGASEHTPRQPGDSSSALEIGRAPAASRPRSHSPKPTGPSIEMREWGSSSASPEDRRRYSHGDRPPGASSSSSAPRGPSPYELPPDSVEAHYFDKPPTIEAREPPKSSEKAPRRWSEGPPKSAIHAVSASIGSAGSSSAPDARSAGSSMSPAAERAREATIRQSGGARGGAGKVAPEGVDAAARSGSSSKINVLMVSVAGLWGINTFLLGVAVIRIFITSQ